MNEDAKKLWKTRAGGSLMAKMLSGEPLAPEDTAHLKALKQADPAKRPPPAQPQKATEPV